MVAGFGVGVVESLPFALYGKYVKIACMIMLTPIAATRTSMTLENAVVIRLPETWCGSPGLINLLQQSYIYCIIFTAVHRRGWTLFCAKYQIDFENSNFSV